MTTSLNKKSLISLFGLVMAAFGAMAADETWLTDFDAAMAQAKAENKVILVEFHGSDWCPPCIKLNNEILSKDAFKSFAESSLILVNADFPRKTKLPEAQQEHNNALARKFGVQVFPTVVLVDKNGNVLDKIVGFPRGGVEGFIASIKDKAAS